MIHSFLPPLVPCLLQQRFQAYTPVQGRCLSCPRYRMQAKITCRLGPQGEIRVPMLSSLFTGPLEINKKVMALVDTGIKCTLKYALRRFLVHSATLRDSQMVPVIMNLPANAGDPREMGSIPELERSPRGGNGNPLQYSCLENRSTFWATVHGVTKSRT